MTTFYARIDDVGNIVEFPLTITEISARNAPHQNFYECVFYNGRTPVDFTDGKIEPKFMHSKVHFFDVPSLKENAIVASNEENYFRGDKTWQVLSEAILNTVLTGLNLLTISPVVNEDSVLIAFGKIQAQLTFLLNKYKSTNGQLEKILPVFKSDNLDHYFLQRFLGHAEPMLWLPPGNSNVVPGIIGMQQLTITGNITVRNVDTISELGSKKRLGIVSDNKAGSLITFRIPAAQYFISNSPEKGGFFTQLKFSIVDGDVGDPGKLSARMFVGSRSSIAAGTNNDPSTLTNVIGIGHGSNDTNLKIYFGGSVSQQPIDLGIDFPVTNGVIYELVIYNARNTSNVFLQITNLNTNIKTKVDLGVADGINLPAPGIMLLSALNCYRTNNNTNGAVGVDIISFYADNGSEQRDNYFG